MIRRGGRVRSAGLAVRVGSCRGVEASGLHFGARSGGGRHVWARCGGVCGCKRAAKFIVSSVCNVC